MTIQPKYVVIKLTDFNDLVKKYESVSYGAAALADIKAANLQDATVLRGQDIFTAGALNRYVDDVLNAANRTSDANLKLQLQTLADRMHDAALMAEQLPFKKVPD